MEPILEFLLEITLKEVDQTVDDLACSEQELKEIIKLLIFEVHGGNIE